MSSSSRNRGPVERVAVRHPVVAIIGRPNVGKSTLFNRLVRARRAITDDRPGVTRDRLYAEVEWDGRRFTLVDTGGYMPGAHDHLEAQVTAQAEAAITEADLILMVCDASVPPTDLDRRLSTLLQRCGKPYLLIANKLDTLDSELFAAELHGLGLGAPHPVSAATGRRSGDLLEAVLEVLGTEQEFPAEEEPAAIRVVVAGRPNVGKSTLVNHLAGERISVVDDRPGTTRDITSVRVAWSGREMLLTDTAGLRRRSRIEDPVEFYSSRRAGDAIQRADVVLVILDAVEGCTAQDARIVGRAIDAGCGLVIAVNKWDRVAAGMDSRVFAEDLRTRFPFLVDYPIVFISALTGKRVPQCLRWIQRVDEHRRMRIRTSRLNEFVDDTIHRNPPMGGGREVRVLYATQSATAPPTIVFFATRADLIDGSYRRYVTRRLREVFGFVGTPLRTAWRSRRER